MQLILYIIFLLPVISGNTIDWEDDLPLQWSDFRGEADHSSDHAAVTYYEIHCANSYPVPGKVNYEITAKFNKEKSWVKTDSRNNDELLAHEQLHFDMAECSARILRMLLNTPVESTQCNDRFIHLRDSVQFSWAELQNEYDEETAHGTMQLTQQLWEERIGSTLNELHRFTEPSFSVPLEN